jgi:O-antigen ligase
VSFVVSVGFVGSALAWSIVSISTAGFGSPALFGLLAVTSGALLMAALARPVYLVISFLGVSFINPALLPSLAEFGEITVRLSDVLLMVWCSVIGIRLLYQRKVAVSMDFVALAAPIFYFLMYIGLSLTWVWLYVPGFLPASVASYLRLLATALVALLAHWSLRSLRDVRLLQFALLTFALGSVVIGIREAWNASEALALAAPDEATPERYGGLLGVNNLGLVSGLLVVSGLARRASRPHRFVKVVVLGFGVTGLFLARSISSILATAGTVAIHHWALDRVRSGRTRLNVRRLTIGALMLTMPTVAIYSMRTDDVTALASLTGGTLAHRLMLASAGLLIFLDHPMVGVGWQASATAEVVGSPFLNTPLMNSFSLLPTHYFPAEHTTSVHNMYIQILAELGIVGFVLFVYSCWRVGRTLRRLVDELPEGSVDAPLMRFHTLVLIFVLIWWNTNPLFGGQIESILVFISLGVLSSLPRLSRLDATVLEPARAHRIGSLTSGK